MEEDGGIVMGQFVVNIEVASGSQVYYSNKAAFPLSQI